MSSWMTWAEFKGMLSDLWTYVKIVAPAPIGALIGMRYAVDQTPRARAMAFLCSSALGAWVASWMGEVWSLTYSGTSVITVVCCSVAMEVMAGINGLARSFSTSPLAFVKQAFDMWRGNKS